MGRVIETEARGDAEAYRRAEVVAIEAKEDRLWSGLRMGASAPLAARPEVDVSAVLGPGVYTLLRNGRVVWVGQALVVAAKIHAHMAKPTPGYTPVKPLVFDEVRVRPCRVDCLVKVLAEVSEAVGWLTPAGRVEADVAGLRQKSLGTNSAGARL